MQTGIPDWLFYRHKQTRQLEMSLFTETWKGFVDFCKKAEPQNRHFDTCERKERVVK